METSVKVGDNWGHGKVLRRKKFLHAKGGGSVKREVVDNEER